MYFKKQLYFIIFIIVLLLLLVFKQTEFKNIKQDLELVNVKVVEVSCSSKLKSKDYSYFMFNYFGNVFKQQVSSEYCSTINVNDTMELYHKSETNDFYLPEILTKGYYQAIIIGLACILIISLIPFKIFLK